jgi:hypothetical protein
MPAPVDIAAPAYGGLAMTLGGATAPPAMTVEWGY